MTQKIICGQGTVKPPQQQHTVGMPPSSAPEGSPLDPAAGGSGEKDPLSWNEFTQNTTFHGVKYIFEETPYRLRRFTWLLTVCGCLVYFVVQVGVRTGDYFRYDTVTTVYLTVQDHLPFPAVTVCNQNSHRLSAAVAARAYTFLDQYYVHGNLTEAQAASQAAGAPVNLSMPLEELMLTTAHSLEHMVDTCTWLGRPCNLTADFRRTITDVGVCYVFNADTRAPAEAAGGGQADAPVSPGGSPPEPRFARRTGQGLSLILNVEQYEHMRGSQSDAGIKMALHAPGDTPLLHEHGFSVAPGMHTTVAATMRREVFMEPPWGECNATAPPVQQCNAARSAASQVERHGCVMPQTAHFGPDAAACDVETAFSASSEDMMEGVEVLGCVMPCNISVYNPTMSYAQLSQINIDRLVLTESDGKAAVLERFLAAMEIRQRVDPLIASTDRDLFSSIYASSQRVLNSSHQLLQVADDLLVVSKNILSALLEDNNVIQRLRSELLGTVNFYTDDITNCALQGFTENIMLFAEHYSYMYFYSDHGDGCWEMLGEGDLKLPVKSYNGNDTVCDTNTDTDGPSGPSFPVVPPEPPGPVEKSGGGGGGSGMSNKSVCVNVVEELSTAMFESHTYLSRALELLNTLLEQYELNVEPILNATTQELDLTDHVACLAGLERLAHKLDELIAVEQALDVFLATDDFGVHKDAFFKLLNDFDWPTLLDGDYIAGDISSCDWAYVLAIKRSEVATLVQIEGIYGAAYAIMQRAYDEVLSGIQPSLAATIPMIQKEILAVLNKGPEYLSRSLTKLSLAEAFTDSDFTSYKNMLKEIGLATKTDINNLIKMTETFGVHVSGVVYYLSEQQIPTMWRNNWEELHLFRNLTFDLEDDPYETMYTVIENDIVKSTLQGPLTTQFTSFFREFMRMWNLVEKAIEVLSAYQAHCVMDRAFLMSNFLQVDIFYKQLNFETVEQVEAFGWASLLSEVGGFMGLLLGASLLTVCELVDYLILICLHAHKKSKAKKNLQPNHRNDCISNNNATGFKAKQQLWSTDQSKTDHCSSVDVRKVELRERSRVTSESSEMTESSRASSQHSLVTGSQTTLTTHY